MSENSQHTRRLREMIAVLSALLDEWRDYSRERLDEEIDRDVRRSIGKYMDWTPPFIDDDSPLADHVALLSNPPLDPDPSLSTSKSDLTYGKVKSSLVMIVAQLKAQEGYERPAISSRPRAISVRVQGGERNPVRR
jgi:hypothetical protein